MRVLQRIVVLVAALMLGTRARVAFAAGDIYVQASAFEYKTPSSCGSATRVGTNQPYVVATCAAGSSFFFHVALPRDAGPGGPNTPNTPGLGAPKYRPIIQWSAQSAQAGNVCWNATAMVMPGSNGYGTAGTSNAFDTLAFTGPTSAPGVGQANVFALQATGDGEVPSSTDLSEVAPGDASGLVANCDAGDFSYCQNNPMVVKVTRNATCNGTALTATADVHMVRLKYN